MVLDMHTTDGWRMWLQFYKRTALIASGGTFPPSDLELIVLLGHRSSMVVAIAVNTFILPSYFPAILSLSVFGICWWANKVPWRFMSLNSVPENKSKTTLSPLTSERHLITLLWLPLNILKVSTFHKSFCLGFCDTEVLLGSLPGVGVHAQLHTCDFMFTAISTFPFFPQEIVQLVQVAIKKVLGNYVQMHDWALETIHM